MGDLINKSELYHIINQAVARCDTSGDTPINKEMAEFAQSYNVFMDKSGQFILFEKPNWSPAEIIKCENLCNLLEKYRVSNNIDENCKLDTREYRELCDSLSFYMPYLLPENKTIAQMVIDNAHRHLPESKERCILEHYNSWAGRVISLRRKRQKEKSDCKDYELNALEFFRDAFHDEELKTVKGCPEKLLLYQNCLKVIDCLPANQYSRTSKYKLKQSFYYAISVTAGELGGDYREMALKAAEKVDGYRKAIENIKRQVAKKYEKKGSMEWYNRRAKDEWDYR